MLHLGFLITILTAFCVALNLDHIDYLIDIPFKRINTSADRIRNHGYPAESHYVTTSDGYILNIFRIPYSPRLDNKHVSRKPVVFLQHGLMDCSDGYLLNGPDNALAYSFADAGFDVWLGNARGNIYSRNHSTILIDNPKFWMFNWHEIGIIDIPESIDYVLKRTGESSLHYVGHSQGGTVYFVMLSMLPEYNEKIKTGHTLAPAIFMGNSMDNILLGIVPYVGKPGWGTKLLADQQFLPYNSLIHRILDSACGGVTRYPKYCRLLSLMWSGGALDNINATLLPQVAETHPAGISTNQAIHYAQLKVSKKFRQYDFGVKKNQKRYNQTEPPEYPLRKVTANTYLYCGLNDKTANASDVKSIAPYLSNVRLVYEVPNPTWAHLDFLFATRVKKEINDPVVKNCKDYENAN